MLKCGQVKKPHYSFADIVLTVLRKYWLPPLKPVVPQYKIHLWWILTLR